MSEKTKEDIPRKKEDVIIINDKEIVITKMKAGKHYECQKSFLRMISAVQKTYSDIELTAGKSKEQLKKEGLESEITYWDVMMLVPDKMLSFVAECLDVDVEFLKTEANPEEIPIAYKKIVELNDFMGNVKNFVTPIKESLGV